MKAPAFQFYAADYLADMDVQMMTLEEEGMYIRLLCYCWREGSLPNDDEQLLRLVKGGSTTALTNVKRRFEIGSNDGSRLVSKRLDAERERQRIWAEKSREGGVKSGEIRRRASPKGGSSLVGEWLKPSSSSSSSKEQQPPTPLSVRVDAKPETTAPLRVRPMLVMPKLPDDAEGIFRRWWTLWGSVRGTNHQDQACRQFLSILPVDEKNLMDCTRSYLESLENPAKGFYPENWLRDQASSGFTARLPRFVGGSAARQPPQPARAEDWRDAQKREGIKAI